MATVYFTTVAVMLVFCIMTASTAKRRGGNANIDLRIDPCGEGIEKARKKIETLSNIESSNAHDVTILTSLLSPPDVSGIADIGREDQALMLLYKMTTFAKKVKASEVGKRCKKIMKKVFRELADVPTIPGRKPRKAPKNLIKVVVQRKIDHAIPKSSKGKAKKARRALLKWFKTKPEKITKKLTSDQHCPNFVATVTAFLGEYRC